MTQFIMNTYSRFNKIFKNFNLEIIDIIKKDRYLFLRNIIKIDKVLTFLLEKKNAKINNLKILNNFSKKLRKQIKINKFN